MDVLRISLPVLTLTLSLLAGVSHAKSQEVQDASDLREALRNATAGDTITLLPGDYFLPSITLRQSGERDAPIVLESLIPGAARIWTDHTTQFKIYGAHWHIIGLDFQGSRNANHALHIVQDADHARIEGNRFQNFHAAIKANGEGDPRTFPDHVQLTRNIFINDYPRDTRSSVVPIDIIGGQDWRITENFIADIAHAPHRVGRNTSAAFVKGGAQRAIFDRNLVICEWHHTGGHRVGLSLGGGGSSPAIFDRRGLGNCDTDCPESLNGRMTNNIILNCPKEPGIYLNRASKALIANNTIYNAFGIQARFPETQARVFDNILTGNIWERDGGEAKAEDNKTTGWLAQASYLPVIQSRIQQGQSDSPTQALAWHKRLSRTMINGLETSLERLGDTAVGKGVGRFDRWFLAPQAGDLRLLNGQDLVAQGSWTNDVTHDFCGQERSNPVDLGAIEYKAGECDLMTELQRRHGPLFTSLTTPKDPAPPDWTRVHSGKEKPLAQPLPRRVIQANPDNYRDKIRALQPGDHLQLSSGTYPRNLRLQNIKGTPEAPIVISGPESGEPAIFEARDGENTISLSRSAHVTVRHLTLDGRGRNAAGVVLERNGRYAHHITLEHLTIRNYDASQGHTGITTRASAWDWTIRNNHIHDIGTGLYLGRPDGSAPFIGGLIENNAIRRTLGYNMQIKHQDVRDRLPGIPTEPRETIIRHNLFSKAERASSDSSARPNLLVGHWPTEGPGRHDRYLIYGNLFHENPHERLFQGEGNVALYNNLFFNSRGPGLIIMRHNDVPKAVYILQNTLVTAGTGIHITHADPDYTQKVTGNALFSPNPLQVIASIDTEHNFTASLEYAVPYLHNATPRLEQLDLYPRPDALVRTKAIPPVDHLPHLDLDYNHRPREQATWGAFDGAKPRNPGRETSIGPPFKLDCPNC
ncbi:chondroitinase-B domain-containing protein [Ectothiorhodospira haloalkaliphila]|uniref:chondroitinase-B domain-containing protein n=1 Tax=Ectothiorhodospira haloalkaliphila TaxID=421628 RepID=UPI0012EBD76A|nr:chondroitinase-B domain-containing protein [Ectothiorhodospira haloalkaliphila]